MKKIRILVVDDDQKLCGLISDYLQIHGYGVTLRHDGESGLREALEGNYSAIILDYMMPKMDGLEMLKLLREQSETPVLMLTSLGEEADRIMGLELGADDYLPKTFSTRELLARLRAVIRRSQASDLIVRKKRLNDDVVLAAGLLSINESMHEAVLGGEILDLTPLEFAILVALMGSGGRVKSREQLVEEISDRRFDVFDRSIDVHVSQLRKKIGDDPKNPLYIRTVRAIGYQFIHEVSKVI